jgi:hypothetical protein
MSTPKVKAPTMHTIKIHHETMNTFDPSLTAKGPPPRRMHIPASFETACNVQRAMAKPHQVQMRAAAILARSANDCLRPVADIWLGRLTANLGAQRSPKNPRIATMTTTTPTIWDYLCVR